jgi:hypothetical protein
MRSFVEVVQDLDDGKVAEQLDREIARLVKSVRETNKSGAITLTVKIKPESGMAIASAEVKTKTPQPATASTLFYTTDEGELRKDDPRQQPLRGLDARPPVPLRSVASAPAPQTTEPPSDGGEGQGA